MPRGRPRKVPVVEVKSDTMQYAIAKILAEYCGVPGCFGRLHLEEASRIMEAIREFKDEVK